MVKSKSVGVGAAVLILAVLTLLSCGVEVEERTQEPMEKEQSAILLPRFAQQAYVKASNTESGDAFGSVAVSADGNTLAVGAESEDSNGSSEANNSSSFSGAVYIYVRSGTTWTKQAYLKASTVGASDHFGRSLALSADGNTLAVGAYGEDSNATNVGGNQADNSMADAGAAYVFRRSGSTWTQQAYVKATNTGSDGYARQLALSGDGNTLAVGAAWEASAADGVGGNQTDESAPSAGAVYVYRYAGTAWTPEAYVKATNSEGGDLFGTSVALLTDGSTLAVGASGERGGTTGVGGSQADNSSVSAGAAYVYTRSGSTWTPQAYVKASNTGAQDNFGGAVSLSGDGSTLAVTATGEDSNAKLVNGNSSDNSASMAGAAYVYVRSGSNWTFHSYIKAVNTETFDSFGTRVALSSDGSMLAVSAIAEGSAAAGVGGNWDDNSAALSSAVYTYSLSAGSWMLSNYVKPSNTEYGDWFWNIALSSDGGTLVVGATEEDSAATLVDGNQASNAASASGAVYVFTSTVLSTYQKQAYVKASNTELTDLFGRTALSDDGNTLAVSAAYEDSGATGIGGSQADNSQSNAGAVYVYTRLSGFWAQQAYVKASNTNGGDYFGWAIALSGDSNTLAVGARSEKSNATGIGGDQNNNSLVHAGAVYIFTRSAGAWTQQAYVKASNTDAQDTFGGALALSADGNTLVVGAAGESSNAAGVGGDQLNNALSNSGAAYVFTRSGGAWSQQAYIKASNPGALDFFGSSVALSSSGDTLGVSARSEDSAATLVNGNGADNSATDSGAAYVFTRSAGTWTQQAYIKAPNTQPNDQLDGVTLSADGNTLAVGALYEDGSAAANSGAAFVYTRSGGTWALQAFLKAFNAQADDNFGGYLALSDDGNTLAVSAVGEDSKATGVNGNGYDNSFPQAGAVFTFTRSGSTWSRRDYVKASNTETSDSFARPALSSDGNTLAVGAILESGGTTGVNGNEADNSAINSGAVYVYTR